MSDSKPPILNALLAGYRDSLDNQIKRLVDQHGVDAVRDSVKRNTKKKPGRKPENDWPILSEFLAMDAIDWLDGRDPMEIRTNYQLAKYVSERTPGQSPVSTHRRVMQKLADKRLRFILIHAVQHAEYHRPVAEYLRAVAALGEIPNWGLMMTDLADRARGMLLRYRDLLGEPDMTLPIAMLENDLSDAAAKPQSKIGFLTATRLPSNSDEISDD
ncbi:hypothetical protein GCM10009424_10650 [Sphingomonas ursincola]|uniref:Uncharacterized protein n=1 Tax=Sphingomonas ursincola TaxID=56361 RepID=A0A7V8REG7_9SPHN|nr:hypothetical protein [Sphingomonas ursincola]MBA1374954.1 hypothetical protein [Sphingomonas ursincola]